VVLIRTSSPWEAVTPKQLRLTGGLCSADAAGDYVGAHELVHLTHRRHTATFWAALGRVMPDYEARRERLRQVGSALNVKRIHYRGRVHNGGESR